MLSNSEVRAIQENIEGYAVEMGFDFFPVVYEMCSHETISEVAAYGGFPSRYPHWSFGMEYERLAKGYGYGLQKIYEMVINTNPVYAYLLDVNQLVDQQLVIAHVCGHAHFFKHNYMFGPTNRKMLDEMANHAVRIRRYMHKYGIERVENFIDCCLTIDDLIDLHAPFIKRQEDRDAVQHEEAEEAMVVAATGIQSQHAYMRDFINPPDFVKAQREKHHSEAMQSRQFPGEPQKDILQFLLEYAPLEAWQRDVLDIVREEAYYFAPQGQTKIMNEGCACWAHTRLMTKHILTPDQIVDYADHHSGTVANHPGRINPYRLGLALLEDIEKRWNRGQFGKEWEEADFRTRKNWNTGAMLGKEKVFEVWKHYNDITFIDEFLTPEFVAEHMLFSYAWDDEREAYEIATRDFKAVKNKLLWGLTNHGRPFIYVKDGNYLNRGELLLWHRFEGMELDLNQAKDVLKNVQLIWGRPVHIETVQEDKTVVFSFDGELHVKE